MTARAPTLTVRLATPNDVPLITCHRRAMYEDMGHGDRAALDEVVERFAEWVRGRIESGEYRGWFVATDNGDVIAGAGVWLQSNPANPRDRSPRRAYVMNVYTRPEYRRRGYARHLMATILQWCREQNIRTVALHSSDNGRALYESLGFRPTNEMRILLPPAE